ncbi:MAG: exodeoxyribonuclease VII small subunit [Lachnospiraceae bacterium]|nr:exodeoxyribonuclease VII small subunit [Lachnospiraceae bacterium]MDD6617952.1 exodeoxyribonuclease VII small subunit [Clostridiales bacterium]
MAKKENRSIEEAMEALDQIAKRLESNEITLEESFQIYKEGMELLQYCSRKIDTVEKKMLQMNEDGTVSEF